MRKKNDGYKSNRQKDNVKPEYIKVIENLSEMLDGDSEWRMGQTRPGGI